MRKVAVLFARSDSVYKTLPECEVYDEGRDAFNFSGGMPVVAHPPCRLFSSLRKLSKAPQSERALAFFAVKQVQRFGGVLEHPRGSKLWSEAGLPRPGSGPDSFGGWSFALPQFFWGHKANKATWFYIVGVRPRDIPDVPFVLGEPTHVVCSTKRGPGSGQTKKELSQKAREATPVRLAEWLIELARRSTPIADSGFPSPKSDAGARTPEGVL